MTTELPDGYRCPHADQPFALKSNEGLGPVPRWWTCATHGDALPQNAWGCPDCVRELRQEVGSLRHALAQSGKLAEDRLEQMQADRQKYQAARRKCAILGDSLREVYALAAWQADDAADPENTSHDDNVSHTNGLIRQACQRGFHGA